MEFLADMSGGFIGTPDGGETTLRSSNVGAEVSFRRSDGLFPIRSKYV